MLVVDGLSIENLRAAADEVGVLVLASHVGSAGSGIDLDIETADDVFTIAKRTSTSVVYMEPMYYHDELSGEGSLGGVIIFWPSSGVFIKATLLTSYYSEYLDTLISDEENIESSYDRAFSEHQRIVSDLAEWLESQRQYRGANRGRTGICSLLLKKEGKLDDAISNASDDYKANECFAMTLERDIDSVANRMRSERLIAAYDRIMTDINDVADDIFNDESIMAMNKGDRRIAVRNHLEDISGGYVPTGADLDAVLRLIESRV